MPPLQIFLLCFACVSMLLYIYIIVVVLYFRQRKAILRGSFFQLVISYFAADLIFFLEFQIFFRLRKYGALNFIIYPGSILWIYAPIISNALHYYIKIVVYIGQIYFSVNRLSSAVFIMKYERYWSSTRVMWLRVIQFILPLAAVLPLSPLVNNEYGVWYELNETQGTVRLLTDKNSTQIIAYIDAGCSALANFLSFVMYVATFLMLRESYKRSKAKSQVRNMEIRLLAASLAMFIVLTLNTVIQIFTSYAFAAGVDQYLFVNDLSYPLIDCMYSCQPWALLLTSSVIRERMVSLIARESPSCKTVSTVNDSMARESISPIAPSPTTAVTRVTA